jgi:stress response protein YsnF
MPKQPEVQDAHVQDAQVIPVVEEHLEISHRQVETGGAVRVRKQVEEVPVELAEQIALDRIEVERVPVGRIISEPMGVRQEGNVTIVPVMEERLVRAWVLVEEIRLTRREQTAEAREAFTLKRDKVVVERFDPATQQWLPEEGGPPNHNQE